MKKSLSLVIIMLLLVACNHMTFDKAKWSDGDGVEYTYRDAMLKDLLSHYHLKGITYKRLTQIVGEPHRDTTNLDSPYYEIATKYDMIDPVYSKALVIYLNKDSVVTGYKVKEWKKIE